MRSLDGTADHNDVFLSNRVVSSLSKFVPGLVVLEDIVGEYVVGSEKFLFGTFTAQDKHSTFVAVACERHLRVHSRPR